jgi:hypothetical protein
VKPEQASKVKSRTPTRLRFGEGPRGTGKQPTDAPVPVHRGSGHGTLEGEPGNWGRPVSGELASPEMVEIRLVLAL